MDILNEVLPIFKEAGAEVEIKETRYAGHARNMANTLDFRGYEGFCVVGGDGTMHEVINGMLSRKDGKRRQKDT